MVIYCVMRVLTYHTDRENKKRHAGDDKHRQEPLSRSVHTVLLSALACQNIKENSLFSSYVYTTLYSKKYADNHLCLMGI